MKSNIIESKYNIIFPLRNNNVLLYNTLSGSLVEINKDEAKKLINNRDTLTKLGYLIKDNFDEIDYLRTRMNSCNNSKILHLSIAPTLKCNFSCNYCYQDNHSRNMSKSTLNSVKNFLNSIINENNVKEATIYWMGGEPLLNKGVITDISNELSKKISFNAILYTNAYFLNQNFINKLQDLNIRTIYLTIDGNEEKHNNKRNINGKPTYKRIKQNIENVIKKWGTKIEVIIRTNIDEDNYSTYNELLDDFSQYSNKIKFTVSPKISKNNKRIFNNFDEIENEFANLIFEKKFGTIKLPKQLCSACPAYSELSYGIDPSGLVYKCIEGLGTDTPPIGKLDNDGLLNLNKKELKKWREIDIFADKVCNKCKYLPLCMGGCLAIRVDSTNTKKNVDKIRGCVIENHQSLEKRIKKFYYEKINK